MPDRNNAPLSVSLDLARSILYSMVKMALARPCGHFDDQFKFAGLITWDIFSNNNDVLTQDGLVADIGSFRGAGRSIGDMLNYLGESKVSYDYMDFYMGTFLAEDMDDEILAPFYRRAFYVLKSIGCSWNCVDRIKDEVLSPPAIVRAYNAEFGDWPEGWSVS